MNLNSFSYNYSIASKDRCSHASLNGEKGGEQRKRERKKESEREKEPNRPRDKE